MIQKRLNVETDTKVFGMGVGQIDKDEVQDMAQFVREKAHETSRPETGRSNEQPLTEEEDPLDKLERLGELHDSGVISEEEFQEKKQTLLDQI